MEETFPVVTALGVNWPHTPASVATLVRIFQSPTSGSKRHFNKKRGRLVTRVKVEKDQGEGDSHLPTDKREWLKKKGKKKKAFDLHELKSHQYTIFTKICR